MSSYTFDCSHVGVNTVRIRVREFDNNPGPFFDYTNDGFCTQTITIQDVTPPTPVCNNLTFQLDDDGMISVFDAATTLTPFVSSPGSAIPDNTPTGVTDIINVPTIGTVADVNVSIDIAHTWVGAQIVMFPDPAHSGFDAGIIVVNSRVDHALKARIRHGTIAT